MPCSDASAGINRTAQIHAMLDTDRPLMGHCKSSMVLCSDISARHEGMHQNRGCVLLVDVSDFPMTMIPHDNDWVLGLYSSL